jgi:hypothetical protein
MLAGPAHARQMAGVKMPDTIQVAGKQLRLNGMGMREATVLKVDVYVAGLYVEQPSSDPAALVNSNQVKVLVLQFVRDVGRDDILKAWRTGFKGNATVPLSSIQPQIDQLNGWMADFSDGDSLTFTYVPGTGVYVDVNRTRKGVLKGDDFARSLFAIWLGPKPPNAALKKGLIGKHEA